MAQKLPGLDDLRRFDLNLLVAFDILITERSVTGAAKRMGVGQPAMSNALSRLRDMFGDPLLVRTSSGLEPTRRALDLVAPIARILAELREEVFSTRAFDPATDRRTFRIGMSDQAEAAIMRDVLHAVRRDAPGICLVARTVDMRFGTELLTSGTIDLAVGYFPEVVGGMEAATLYRETFVCLFDARACGVMPPLSLDDYATLLLACTAVGAVATATPAVAADHPDAALISACAEFTRLEQVAREMSDNELEANWERIDALQDPLFRLICTTPAATLDGLRTKAATARFWNATRDYVPELEDGMISDFVASIWRDVGGPVAPWCNHEPRFSGRFTAPTGCLACEEAV